MSLEWVDRDAEGLILKCIMKAAAVALIRGSRGVRKKSSTVRHVCEKYNLPLTSLRMPGMTAALESASVDDHLAALQAAKDELVQMLTEALNPQDDPPTSIFQSQRPIVDAGLSGKILLIEEIQNAGGGFQSGLQSSC